MVFVQYSTPLQPHRHVDCTSFPSDTPVCEPSEVEYPPGEESVKRMEEWMEMAVADTLVRNDPGLASCKQYVR